MRIYTTADSRFDEVACREHANDLEVYADAVLGKNNGVMRMHVSGNSKYQRGDAK